MHYKYAYHVDFAHILTALEGKRNAKSGYHSNYNGIQCPAKWQK